MSTASQPTATKFTDVSDNPLYKAWKAKGFVKEPGWGWDRPMIKSTSHKAMHAEVMARGKNHMDRQELCAKYSWAVPSPVAINWISERCKKICEIGAGRGYWAQLLTRAGCNVVAYDQTVNEAGDELHANHYHASEHGYGLYFPVQRGEPEVARQHAGRTLMLCWPPYDDPMAAECLLAYEGNELLFIGEGDGGCTGGEDFWKLLGKSWTEIGDCSIPQWPCIRDYVTLYQRNVKRAVLVERKPGRRFNTKA